MQMHTDLDREALAAAASVAIAQGMRDHQPADVAVIDVIVAQRRRHWKRYAQAFTGLDAADIAETEEAAA